MPPSRASTFLRSRPGAAAALALVVVLAAIVALVVWMKLAREKPQPTGITGNGEQNFLHGAIAPDGRALPYWVAVVLPRVFGGQYLPGPGGYAALGVVWREGTELPAGFAKTAVGVDRVVFNCALCHTAQ